MQTSQIRYTVIQKEVVTGPYISVCVNGEEIGRILMVGSSFHARHICRHQGGVFQSKRDAFEYVVGVDMQIDAVFDDALDIAHLDIAHIAA